MSITSTTPLGDAPSGVEVPRDPYKFAKDIQHSQPDSLRREYSHRILFNKGRYFETSIYDKKIISELCDLTGFKIQYGNMIVESWKYLEDFVIAMNILGIYVYIDIDWI